MGNKTGVIKDLTWKLKTVVSFFFYIEFDENYELSLPRKINTTSCTQTYSSNFEAFTDPCSLFIDLRLRTFSLGNEKPMRSFEQGLHVMKDSFRSIIQEKCIG